MREQRVQIGINLCKKDGESAKRDRPTIAILPENTKRPKTFSKQDIASTSTEQTKVLKKVGRRAQINDTSTSSEPEQPAPKKGKVTKRGEAKTPEVAIEFEKERPPSIIDISSNTTESKVQPKGPVNQGEM